jgi:nucleoid-associated protein YgaU
LRYIYIEESKGVTVTTCGKIFCCIAGMRILSPLCAQEAADEQEAPPAAERSAPASAGVADNEYLKEARRFSNLARLAMLDGSYENAVEYSAEAVRYAGLSDAYIKHLARLTPAFTEAVDRLRWSETSGALAYYPDEIGKARADLRTAYAEKRAQNWDEAYRYALLVIEDLAGVAAPPPQGAMPPEDLPKSPNQYKVRPWDIFGDCFWNIAKWFYGDPRKWPAIYEANKDKLPDPGNPDWVEVDTVLDLPSIGREIREGYWDSGRAYHTPAP